MTVAVEVPIWLTRPDITALERHHGIRLVVERYSGNLWNDALTTAILFRMSAVITRNGPRACSIRGPRELRLDQPILIGRGLDGVLVL